MLASAAIRHDDQTEGWKRRGLQEIPRRGGGGFGQDSRMQYQELFHALRQRPLSATVIGRHVRLARLQLSKKR